MSEADLSLTNAMSHHAKYESRTHIVHLESRENTSPSNLNRGSLVFCRSSNQTQYLSVRLAIAMARIIMS